MATDIKNLKIALVHDWLLGVGGAEKVVKTLHEIFPSAPIYTLLHNKKFTEKFLPNVEIRSTFLQKIFNFTKSHKTLLPLMPIAVESLDLSEFDVVISSSVTFAKGLILKPQTLHICYCHSPTRQIWDWHSEYKKESKQSNRLVNSVFQHLLRIWDRHASTRVDQFIATSENVKHRIQKYYQRNSELIYPPVDLVSANQTEKGEYFLIVSRLFKHKNVGIAVEAFNKLGWPLVIIGEGPEYKKLRKMAEKNVKFMGYQPDDLVQKYYAGCSGFIMPQEEDFGITPIEAMGHGKPVLALKRGGALEYVQEGINGEFFEDPTEEVLADGVRRIRANISKYDPSEIKRTVERFSRTRFESEIKNLISSYVLPS
ncbi:MAG: glycosyltransferase [Candidatus Paceibacterota bacterium]